MDIEIASTLRKVGLTEGEIKVYLALLNLGSTTVGPIIEKARVSSSKVYIILEKLIQKGLASYITKEKTKYFQASQPIALIDYVSLKEKQIQETKASLNKIIKKIARIKESKKTSEQAKIYKGYEGLKTGLFEAIKTIPDKGEYYFFSTGYGNQPYLKRFFTKLALELKKRKISIKGIAHKDEEALYKGYYSKKGYKMKFTNIKWPSDIGIVGDFLTILVWDKEEPVLYLMRSEVLVRSYLSFFNENWVR